MFFFPLPLKLWAFWKKGKWHQTPSRSSFQGTAVCVKALPHWGKYYLVRDTGCPPQSVGHYQREVEGNICWSLDRRNFNTHKPSRGQRESAPSALHLLKVNNIKGNWQLLYFHSNKTILPRPLLLLYSIQHSHASSRAWMQHILRLVRCEVVRCKVTVAGCQQTEA